MLPAYAGMIRMCGIRMCGTAPHPSPCSPRVGGDDPYGCLHPSEGMFVAPRVCGDDPLVANRIGVGCLEPQTRTW